jgi:hypothetical protein
MLLKLAERIFTRNGIAEFVIYLGVGDRRSPG